MDSQQDGLGGEGGKEGEGGLALKIQITKDGMTRRLVWKVEKPMLRRVRVRYELWDDVRSAIVAGDSVGGQSAYEGGAKGMKEVSPMM